MKFRFIAWFHYENIKIFICVEFLFSKITFLLFAYNNANVFIVFHLCTSWSEIKSIISRIEIFIISYFLLFKIMKLLNSYYNVMVFFM